MYNYGSVLNESVEEVAMNGDRVQFMLGDDWWHLFMRKTDSYDSYKHLDSSGKIIIDVPKTAEVFAVKEEFSEEDDWVAYAGYRLSDGKVYDMRKGALNASCEVLQEIIDGKKLYENGFIKISLSMI